MRQAAIHGQKARQDRAGVSPEPAVNRLAGHPEPARDLGHGEAVVDHQKYRLISLLHDRQLHQRHGNPP